MPLRNLLCDVQPEPEAAIGTCRLRAAIEGLKYSREDDWIYSGPGVDDVESDVLLISTQYEAHERVRGSILHRVGDQAR